MSSATTPEPKTSAEVLLRVRLSDGLNVADLAELSRHAEEVGSLDSAVIQLIRSGLGALRHQKEARP
jgi:hypothetical protein